MPTLSRHMQSNSLFAVHLPRLAVMASMDRLRVFAGHLNADTCAGSSVAFVMGLAGGPRPLWSKTRPACAPGTAKSSDIVGIVGICGACRCWRGHAVNKSNGRRPH
jgi:hypothetical protein